jgi:Fe-S-cluster containining protein
MSQETEDTIEERSNKILYMLGDTREQFKEKVLAEMDRLEKEIDRCKTKSGAVNAVKFMQWAFSENDRLVRNNLKMYKERLGEEACSGTCSICCHDYIICSPAESVVIAKYMHDKKLTADKVRLHVSANKAVFDSFAPDHANRICPLLDPWGQCKVYEVRPLVCRNHYCTRDFECQQIGELAKLIPNILGAYFIAAFDSLLGMDSLSKQLIKLKVRTV